MPCSSSTFSRCDSTAGATPRSEALKSWNLRGPHQQIADDQQRPALAEKLQRPRDGAGLSVFFRHGASIRLIIKKIVTTIFLPVNISALFVRRPIATSLLMLAVALFGVLAYAALPVSDLPSIDFPTLSVGAGLPGGDPETLASSIASPLERQFTAIAGLDSMTSSSALGTTSVTLQFDLDRSIDGAAVDVQTAIAEALPLLPPGMPSAPTFRKVNPADQPIFVIALSSDTRPLSEIDSYAQTLIAPQVAALSGVAQVNVLGGQKYAVRVQVDPDRLRAQGIGINEVDQLLQSSNVNLPTGQLFGPTGTFTIRANGQLMTADAFRPMILGFHNRAPVRLRAGGDGDRQRRGQPQRILALRSGSRATRDSRLGAEAAGQQHARGDRLDQAAAAADQQPAAAGDSPDPGHRPRRCRFAPRSRTSRSRWRRRLFLVVFVIYLFLQNASATLIPALALPFSILGTFVVMRLMHFSLNNMSLMALILSFGFVVDDAIVMLENIVRHLEEGADPLARDARRLARSRLHDPQHDRVARRGVHPGAVSRRHPRPAVSRIRRHDHRGGGDFRAGVGVADADALQPAAARASQGRRRAVDRPRLRRVPPPVRAAA